MHELLGTYHENMWEMAPTALVDPSSAASDSTGAMSQRRDGDEDTSGEAAAKQRSIAPAQATGADSVSTGEAKAAAVVAAMIAE